jgi:hypothetical protein
MPKTGDRVVVEGSKVGGGRREGTLVGTVGTLIKVRWSDGGETIMAPGAGAVRFFPGSGGSKTAKSGNASSKKAPAAKKQPKPAGKPKKR